MSDETETETPKRGPGRPKKVTPPDEERPALQGTEPVDNDRELLSAAEVADIAAEVEEEARAEEKAQARKELKAKLKAEARQRKGLGEAQVQITIDLAPYCDRLLIDNVAYLQGMTYTVRATVADVMREQMQRTWAHQSEIDGKASDFYRRARNTRFSMATGAVSNGPVVNTSQLLKA